MRLHLVYSNVSVCCNEQVHTRHTHSKKGNNNNNNKKEKEKEKEKGDVSCYKRMTVGGKRRALTHRERERAFFTWRQTHAHTHTKKKSVWSKGSMAGKKNREKKKKLAHKEKERQERSYVGG